MSLDIPLTKVKGLGPVMAERLRASGFTTVESIAIAPARVLADVLGVSEEKAAKISQAARDLLGIKFVTAEEYFKQRSKVAYITTGCKALDEMLGGGVETGAITEFVGEFGTGKTQICHQLCVTVQLPPEKGGLSARAVYIDTEGTFRPERIIQIASRFELEPASALKNVYYAKVRNLAEQVACLVELRSLIKEGVKLVVVDSVIAHFKGTYEDPDFFTRVHELVLYLSELRNLALDHRLAVVITNRITSIPEGTRRFKVSGDPFVSMFVDYRVLLHKVRENIRRAMLVFGKHYTRIPVLFKISEEGVVDLS